ncbi:MAG: hypothetical protein CL899_04010 [Dehalococcoidia bacterium]|nr:hypothetical protein [Dehalococcoidia bacterium]
MNDAGGIRRVMIINQYYAPDVASSGQLIADLCEGLVEVGHEVTVVCSQPSYDEEVEEAPHFEELDGVKIHRVRMRGTTGRRSIVLRTLGYIRFLIFSWWIARGLVSGNKYDVVVAFSNPPFVGVVGALIARKGSIPFLSVLYDIHPDIVRSTNWINLPKVVFSLWEQITCWILSQASSVVVLGQGMKQTLIDTKKVNSEAINVIPVWARPEFDIGQEPDPETKSRFAISDEEFIVTFAGNIGIMQPIEHVLDAAERLRTCNVRFLFLGGGVGFERISDLVAKKNLSNVTILSYQPFTEFKNLLLSSDVCLVTLADGMEKLSVPSRAYTFLSAGKPIIAVMNVNSDVSVLVSDTKSGWVVDSGIDLSKLLESLVVNNVELIERGTNASNCYKQGFTKQIAIRKFSELIGQIS